MKGNGKGKPYQGHHRSNPVSPSRPGEMFFPDTVQNTIGNDTFEFTALTKNARINSNDKVV